ncbi:MAG: hypothetical protein JWL88_575 [Parcubacteria group bacterium]|nr:hypothetical protein [Parcubacteria group bacterium]
MLQELFIGRAGLDSLRIRARDAGSIDYERERAFANGFIYINEEEDFLAELAVKHTFRPQHAGKAHFIAPGTALFEMKVLGGQVCDHLIIDSTDIDFPFYITIFCTDFHWTSELIRSIVTRRVQR